MNQNPPVVEPAPINSGTKLPQWQRSMINIWLIASMVIVVLSIFGHMKIAMNNDQLAFILYGEKLFAGARPYVDWVEVNPPMIYLIYAIPLYIHHATDIFVRDIFNTYFVLVVSVSLFLSFMVLWHSTVSSYVRNILLSSLALGLFTVSFIHNVFGDREHLMIVMMAPWFILFSPYVRYETVPLKWRLSVAVFAAFGFAIKPYAYIFYVATVVYSLIRGATVKELIKQFEHYIVIGVAFIYLLAMLTYFSAWFTEIVPLASKTYWAISWGLSSKLDIIQQEFFARYAVLSLAGVGVIWLVTPNLYIPAINYLLLLLLACVGYYLMNAGWHYTQYPFMAVSWMLLVLVSVLYLKICGKIIKKFQHRLSVLLITAVFGSAMYFSYILPALDRASWDMRLTHEKGHPIGTKGIEDDAAARIYHYLDQNPEFMLLAINHWGANIRGEAGIYKPVGRFDFLWFLPGIVEMAKQPHRRHEAKELMDYLGNSLAEDLDRFKPGVIISDISPQQRSLPPSYNVIEALKDHKVFMEQLDNYVLKETPNACTRNANQNCAYEIYVRKEPK